MNLAAIGAKQEIQLPLVKPSLASSFALYSGGNSIIILDVEFELSVREEGEGTA